MLARPYKPPRLTRWNNPETKVGLLLFAQRLQEALYDYSLDTYKAPALNTHTRAIELVSMIEEVEAGHVKVGALRSMTEELADSIQRDDVARELIGPAHVELQSEHWWASKSPERLKVQANLVRGALWHRRYEQALRHRLHEIIPEGKRKDDITRLASQLVVEWIQLGFSRDYIYYLTRTYFFRRTVPEYALVEFFAYFDEPTQGFDVILRGSTDWSTAGEMFPSAYLVVSSSPPKPRAGLNRESAFLDPKRACAFITFSDVQAKDQRAASEHARAQLLLAAGVFGLHRHRSDYTCDDDSLVYQDKHPTVLGLSASALHKEEDCDDADFRHLTRDTLRALTRGEQRETAFRLAAALGLHTSAMRSKDDPVQLSVLWSSIETLLPASGEEARIAGITDRVVPALSQRYPLKLLRHLHHALLAGCEHEYKTALGQLPPGEELAQAAALVILPEHVGIRRTLFASLERNPLLRHRLYRISESYQDAREVLRHIEAHELRVRWHLERIYRSRNMYVHSGKGLPYRKTIAENLHSYFHILMRSVIDALNGTPPATDLDTAFYKLRLEHDAHLRALRALDPTKVTAASLRIVLVGPYGAWRMR